MIRIDERISKSELTYDWIRERIVGREFNPGYRLVLGAIAKELGISVVPVREAVRRLEAEGLIEFERNVGARVAMVNQDEYIDTMQTLGVLEGAATALALPLMLDADLARAQAINDSMRAMLEDFDPVAFTSLNEKFHRALFQRCPNPHISELADRGWNRMSGLRSSTFAFVPDRAPRSVQEHDDILRLIRENAEPLEIEMAVRQHKWRTVEAYRQQRTDS
ncbi:GntR family transcriptional regulator [Nesterenkonia sp. LB17]|uniref:GntR family transcriptional regulator n=1 Tax=unclassified Nesterenkonia TaxID=2629769 RepID=UPI001F4CF85C|nr:GntR family transcriptional regulator [Nesterenkonia sp. DZ6]MCH8563051.1 GntR family transcriptional regulator [Nesterenkonia sp. YGD6]MCH8565133.1 GntR family transcriptional regulator [Nesterenkonia sp. LB17]MCH8571471.1 GntR family transcriptional regulator [Nesterenkonia sp. AY15]